MAAWSALALLPDADVVGFALGVPYAAPWGHRGATHSFAFSIVLGALIGVAARWFGRPAIRTALVAIAVLVSHPILDTMTDGGLGCALWWPFDAARHFAPWRPIPVAPIGPAFVSASGAIIAATELVLLGPAVIFALRSQRMNARYVAVLSAAWLGSVWLIASTDPVRDAAVGFVLRENTAFARGFSEDVFRSVKPGEGEEHVRRRLGSPLEETWIYLPPGDSSRSAMTIAGSTLPHSCAAVEFEAGAVATTLEATVCRELGIEIGMSAPDVKRRLGSPSESCWRYSRSPRNRRYRLRMVCFAGGRVSTVIRRWD